MEKRTRMLLLSIVLFCVDLYRPTIGPQMIPTFGVGPAQSSRFLMLTKWSAASEGRECRFAHKLARVAGAFSKKKKAREENKLLASAKRGAQ